MKRILLVVLVAVLPLSAQERITLTTPVQKTVSNWSIEILHLEPSAGRVIVRCVSNVATEPAVERVYDARTTPTHCPPLLSVRAPRARERLSEISDRRSIAIEGRKISRPK